jgi:hypothetical protein
MALAFQPLGIADFQPDGIAEFQSDGIAEFQPDGIAWCLKIDQLCRPA